MGLKLVPSYTLICNVDLSNHSSPANGAVGADVDAEFSNNFTRFSFSPSPKPEYDFQNNCNVVVLSTVPSVIVTIAVPSVLLITYAIYLYL